MQLQEMIYQLRTGAGMSQGDLADRLEVSRQSVSKWETGGAVPDLDKLVKMADLFGVSLDELVKGETPPLKEEDTKPEPQVIYVERAEPALPRRKISGYALYGLALLVIVLCTVLGGLLAGVILSIPFWVCGAICFIFEKRAGLWCSWAVFFMADLFLRYANGITWGSIFAVLRGFVRNDAAKIVAIVMFGLIALLIYATVRSYRQMVLEPTRNVCVQFGIKLGVLALCSVPWPISLLGQQIATDGQMLYHYARAAQLLSMVLQFGKVILFTWLLIDLLGIRRWKRGQQNG